MKENTLALALIGGLLGALLAVCLMIGNTLQNDSIRTEQPYIECGSCGAHVIEWWKVRNIDNTDFVEVCGKCYDLVAYE